MLNCNLESTVAVAQYVQLSMMIRHSNTPKLERKSRMIRPSFYHQLRLNSSTEHTALSHQFHQRGSAVKYILETKHLLH